MTCKAQDYTEKNLGSYWDCSILQKSSHVLWTPERRPTAQLTRPRESNRQLEIGNEFTLPPLASNDLLDGGGENNFSCEPNAATSVWVKALIASTAKP